MLPRGCCYRLASGLASCLAGFSSLAHVDVARGCCGVGRGRVEEEVRCGVSGPTGMTPSTHFASVGRSRSPHSTAPCACTIGLFVSIDHTSSGCSFQDDSIILTFTFFDVICPLARTVGSHLTLCTSLGPATRLVFARPFAFAGSSAFGATLGLRAASPFIFLFFRLLPRHPHSSQVLPPFSYKDLILCSADTRSQLNRSLGDTMQRRAHKSTEKVRAEN